MYLLQKIRYRFSTDRAVAARMASHTTQQAIIRSLKSLNPKIPVIHAENSGTAPYSMRREWNHFWLVDLVNNSSNPGSQDTGVVFSISIALIEDRKPILGVVYTPSTDTTYYAMTGKGAFKVENHKKPYKLCPREEHSGESFDRSEITPSRFDLSSDDKAALLTDALRICLITEEKCDVTLTLQGTMEWQTAAAHAIAIATGIKINSCESNEELTYNKEDFANGCIVIK